MLSELADLEQGRGESERKSATARCFESIAGNRLYQSIDIGVMIVPLVAKPGDEAAQFVHTVLCWAGDQQATLRFQFSFEKLKERWKILNVLQHIGGDDNIERIIINIVYLVDEAGSEIASLSQRFCELHEQIGGVNRVVVFVQFTQE